MTMKKQKALHEIQAHEIMTNPVEAVRMKDSVQDVAHLFTEKNISAAAVLDEKSNPIGVITKTDLVRHEQETDGLRSVNKFEFRSRYKNVGVNHRGFHIIDDEDTVQSCMTPVIFSVKPSTSLRDIARRMIRYGIHHIFVRGQHGEPVVGIVSSFDVLRRIAHPYAAPED